MGWKIHKYTIGAGMANGCMELVWPKGSVPLAVGSQAGGFVLWGQVDTDQGEREVLAVDFVWTGQSVPDPQERTYLGTVQDQRLVFHVYVSREAMDRRAGNHGG